MKGLLKLNKLQSDMPLVYDWLQHAETTRRLVLENYPHYSGEELVETLVAENVLIQIDNLKTYPVVRARLHQNKLRIYGWIYRIENGEVLAYDTATHTYVPPQSQLSDNEEPDGVRSLAPPVTKELPTNKLRSDSEASLTDIRAELDRLLAVNSPQTSREAERAISSLAKLFERGSKLGMTPRELKNYHSLFSKSIQIWARKVHSRN